MLSVYQHNFIHVSSEFLMRLVGTYSAVSEANFSQLWEQSSNNLFHELQPVQRHSVDWLGAVLCSGGRDTTIKRAIVREYPSKQQTLS